MTGTEVIQFLLKNPHLLNCKVVTDGGDPWRQIEMQIDTNMTLISPTSEAKIECPFINNLSINSKVDCIYLVGSKCYDIEIAPDNDVAWCTQKIQDSI